MNFLRALFWIVLTIVVVVFSMRNWTVVTLNIFGGLAADVKLPVLVLGALLLGFLPTYGWYRFRTWQLARRLQAAERALATSVSSTPAEPPLAGEPAPSFAPAPTSAVPLADV